ncbi:unnamed protein product [Peniophora sp. CBMAI 1063]|nr:unnamed protein product [Peniophora sp. CBMAI 1063]
MDSSTDNPAPSRLVEKGDPRTTLSCSEILDRHAWYKPLNALHLRKDERYCTMDYALFDALSSRVVENDSGELGRWSAEAQEWEEREGATASSGKGERDADEQFGTHQASRKDFLAMDAKFRLSLKDKRRKLKASDIQLSYDVLPGVVMAGPPGSAAGGEDEGAKGLEAGDEQSSEDDDDVPGLMSEEEWEGVGA